MLLGPSASPFEICGYLLRCCEKINPQRIKDTPAVNFFSRLGSTSPISKGISVPPRMAVVLFSSDVFVQQKLAFKN